MPSYTAPVSRSIQRMKELLFQPFDFEKWLVLGFTAWLAGILDGGGTSGSSNVSGPIFPGSEEGEASWPESREELFEKMRPALEQFQENLHWILPLTIAVTLLLVALGLVLLWISSRAKFMFLDNVVHNRAWVERPWRAFRAQGNSLFVWRLWFGILTSVIFLLWSVASGWLLVFRLDPTQPDAVWWWSLGGVVMVATGFGLLLAYILMLLEDVVIPIMYRERTGTSPAWSRALSLHWSSFPALPLFFLWKILLGFGASLIILTVVLGTCCIAGFILAIPYLGAVLLLPVTVFFRALGPEFIQQFGAGYQIWDGPAPPPPPPAGP